VITRLWRGWAPADRAEEYERHYGHQVLPMLRGVAGFEGARLLRRAICDETELVSLTFFDGLDALRAFGGPGCDTAVVADEARDGRGHFDDHAGHDETAFETS
jgi:hypothetical protein